MTHKNFLTQVPLFAVLAISVLVIAAAILSSGGQTPSTPGAQSAGTLEGGEPTALTTEVAAPEFEFTGDFVRKEEGSFTITGQVVVFTDDSGTQWLRLTDDFRTNLGNDTVVALRAADGEIVSLGQLQAESGQQDFALAEGTDLTIWDEVLIWDNAIDAAFGTAFLEES